MEKRDKRIMVMMSQKEKEKLEKQADKIGLSISGYIRMLINSKDN